MTTAQKIAANCPQVEGHTASPSGYMEFHDWAYDMDRTHVQRQCDVCKMWVIWVPREESP